MTPESGEALLSATGPARVINLTYRSDRRSEFEAQLKRIGLSLDHPQIRLFAAIRPEESGGFPTIGTRGCFLSHLAVLREAIAAGQDSILICEDDLDFTPDMISRLPGLLAGLMQQPWDLFYGSYADLPAGKVIAPGLIRADPSETIVGLSFYAVRGKAIADLVHYLEAILTRAPGDPAGGPMHVDGAVSHFRADHPQYTTLVASPPIGVQRSSRTDIHDLKWFDRLPVLREVTSILRGLRRRAR